MLHFFSNNKTYTYNSYHFSTLTWHSQNHACWCPGNARSQDISNHDVDLVQPRLLGPHMLRVKNTQKLVYLGVPKSSFHNILHIFQCMDQVICVEFQTVTQKFNTKISYLYTERYGYHKILKIEKLSVWRAPFHFLNTSGRYYIPWLHYIAVAIQVMHEALLHRKVSSLI